MLLGFYWFLMGFTGLYWAEPGSIGFYQVLLNFSGFYWSWLVFNGFYWVFTGFLLGLTEFYWIWQGLSRFYWLFTGFLLDFDSSRLGFAVSNRVELGWRGFWRDVLRVSWIGFFFGRLSIGGDGLWRRGSRSVARSLDGRRRSASVGVAILYGRHVPLSSKRSQRDRWPDSSPKKTNKKTNQQKYKTTPKKKEKRTRDR